MWAVHQLYNTLVEVDENMQLKPSLAKSWELSPDNLLFTFHLRTDVYFHELTKTQIENYVDKYRPYDKAGAYAIQEWIGVVGIRSIDGDFYNVMGLPVSRVVQELAQLAACQA